MKKKLVEPLGKYGKVGRRKNFSNLVSPSVGRSRSIFMYTGEKEAEVK